MGKNKKDKPGFFQEFKAFINKGNAMALAIGVVIGAAFGAITSSLVNDIIMPIVGLVTKDGFFKMYVGIVETGILTEDITLSNGVVVPAGQMGHRAYLMYGNLIQAILNFLIIALTLFIIMKVTTSAQKKLEAAKAKEEPKEEPAPVVEEPKGPTDNELLMEIRDLLKEKKEK